MAFITILGYTVYTEETERFYGSRHRSARTGKERPVRSITRASALRSATRAEQVDETEDAVFVEGLDRSFRPCCYQSARLADKYCPCGRAVDKELMNYLSKSQSQDDNISGDE